MPYISIPEVPYKVRVKRKLAPFERKLKLRRAVLFDLARKYGWVCWYCGLPLNVDDASIDHIVPVGYNGSHDRDNLALACRTCNYAKGTMSLEVYLDWLEGIKTRDWSPIYGRNKPLRD